MNKKHYYNKLKYYGIALLMAVPVIILITVLTAGKVNEVVLWVITAVICLIDIFIAIILEPKVAARQQKKLEEKKKNSPSGDYDPYSD